MKLPDVFKKKLQRKIFRKNKHNSVPIRTYRFKPKFQNNWLTARLKGREIFDRPIEHEVAPGFYEPNQMQLRAQPNIGSVGPYWFSRAYPHRDLAMKIPIISGSVDLISSMIASMPVKLYKRVGGKTIDISESDDSCRAMLLNHEPNENINGYQFKKAMVTDYLLSEGGYAYIKKRKNKIMNLYYVPAAYVFVKINGTDPIFQKYTFTIGEKDYKPYEIIKLIKNTTNGVTGHGLTIDCKHLIERLSDICVCQSELIANAHTFTVAYPTERITTDSLLEMQENINKAVEEKRNIAVLNEGINFQEINLVNKDVPIKDINSAVQDDIKAFFHIEEDFDSTFKKAIYPIIQDFEAALNSTLLLESEKSTMFFKFDTNAMLKSDAAKERFEAYKLANEVGLMSVNGIRELENQEQKEGLDVLNFGLKAVLFDTKTGDIYVPNTKETVNLKSLKQQGGFEKDDNNRKGPKPDSN